MLITPAEYTLAMRRLEAMRNEALGLKDRSALAEIARREADLNSVFFGREPAPGPRGVTPRRPPRRFAA